MEKVTIEKQILDQIDRQLDFSYSAIEFFGLISGMILTIAVLVIGYQIFMNKRIVKGIEDDNRELVTKVTAPIFVTNIKQIVRTGMYDIDDIKSLVHTYKENYSQIEAVKTEIKFLEFSYIKKVIEQVSALLPEKCKDISYISIDDDPIQLINNAEKSLKESEDYSKDEIKTKVLKMDNAKKEVEKVKLIFKNID